MPGLIDAQPQQAAQPIQQAQQMPAQQPQQMPSQPTPEAVAATKQKTFQVQKIVLAAQKVMYGEKTGSEFLKMLQGDDVVKIAANAATNIMLILIGESKLQVNAELIIPAGVIVIGDVLDFIEKAKGTPHTEVQVEDAIEAFIQQIMAAMGAQKQGAAQQPEVVQ